MSTNTRTSKPNLLWRSLPWLTSKSLLHDAVSSGNQKILEEWRGGELEELDTVNVTVSASSEAVKENTFQ